MPLALVVDYLRRPTPQMVLIIKDNEAAICGATLAEIYAGARSPGDFSKYDRSLSVFGRVSIAKKTWHSLGRNLALLGQGNHRAVSRRLDRDRGPRKRHRTMAP